MPKRYKKYKLSEHKITVFMVFLVSAILAVVLLVGKSNVAVLNPKGWVAYEQTKVMLASVLLMLIVVVPVYFLTFKILRTYKEERKSKYSPDEVNDTKTQLIFWAIPTAIVSVLIAIMWISAHKLDPFKPLNTDVQPMTIQVVALEWKWLFIYPELNIATVNFVEFPEDTPINFELTADAPMNSFWIPSLGGQMYAMPGMSTQLHLIADEPGDFAGSAAEINGKGFAGMKFVARSASRADFNSWVQTVHESQGVLDTVVYEQLAKPSENNSIENYASVQQDLFTKVMTKFMPAGGHMQAMEHK